jgi:hypothetical protein
MLAKTRHHKCPFSHPDVVREHDAGESHSMLIHKLTSIVWLEGERREGGHACGCFWLDRSFDFRPKVLDFSRVSAISAWGENISSGQIISAQSNFGRKVKFQFCNFFRDLDDIFVMTRIRPSLPGAKKNANQKSKLWVGLDMCVWCTIWRRARG